MASWGKRITSTCMFSAWQQSGEGLNYRMEIKGLDMQGLKLQHRNAILGKPEDVYTMCTVSVQQDLCRPSLSLMCFVTH